MIRECIGFVERYIKHYKPEGKTDLSFIIDDIFLETANEDETLEAEEINDVKNVASDTLETEETDAKKQKKSTNREEQVFIIFPFESSETGLKLDYEKVFVAKKPKDVSELLELEIVKNYGYSEVVLEDLKQIFNHPKKHISLVSDNNKRIGGSQNLSSSVIYAVELVSSKITKDGSAEFKKGSLKGNSLDELLQLKKDDKLILKNRLDNFAYDEKYSNLCKMGVNSIGKELAKWLFLSSNVHKISSIQNIMSENQGSFSLIAISLIPKNGSSNPYSTIREEYFKQKVFNNDPVNKGICANCQNLDRFIETPQSEIAIDGKKRFLTHPTMMQTGKNKPIMICHECALKYAAFFGLLKKWKIKIMPLFIDTKLQENEIRLFNEKGVNSFSQIFNQLGESNSLEFYVVLFSFGKLKYFDYVCNYNWKLDWVYQSSHSEESDAPSNKISRSKLEWKVCSAMGIKYMDYFEEKKGLDTLQSYLRNLLSEKVFHFVYRNRNHFTTRDLWKLSILPIEKLALGPMKDFNNQINKQIQACLEIWFNRNYLLNLNGGTFMSINELRNLEPVGASTERWAYHAGRAYRFLVSKRASGASLELEPIVRAHHIQNVKGAIVKKLEQRAHALDEKDLKQFNLQMAELLAFNEFNGIEFNDLKPYFYAGYVDAIKYEKKTGGDSNE